MLDGRRLLVTGVLTRGSIAFEAARRAQELGAEVVLTGFGRGMRLTERAAGHLPETADVLELDVNSDRGARARCRRARPRAGDALDGVLHAIAFAPPDALGGGFLETPAESAITAFQTSAFSLKALVAGLLAAAGGRAGRRPASSGWTSTRPWPGRSMTGWASRRRRSRASRATWRATSARRTCA